MSNLLTNLLVRSGAVAPLNHRRIALHRRVCMTDRIFDLPLATLFGEDSFRPLFIRDEAHLEVIRNGSR